MRTCLGGSKVSCLAVANLPILRCALLTFVGIVYVRATKQWNRATMVEALLQYCNDKQANSGIIRNELSDWEKITTQSAFDKALTYGSVE